MSKILIIGATGFVGRRLAGKLAGKGHQVYAAGRNMRDSGLDIPGVGFVECDLRHLDVSVFPKVDVVFSMAQSRLFRSFPGGAEDIFEVNIASVFKICQWAKDNSSKFILVSSGGIYGGKCERIFKEDDMLAVDCPLGFYLGSKLCSEIIFQNYMEFFETAVILRPFFIYGAGQRPDMFVSRIINNVREGRPVILRGEDGGKFNPVYVDDAVSSFANAMSMEGKHIINVAGTEVLSLRRIAEIIGAKVGKAPVFQMVEGEPEDYVGNIEQASSKLGRPTTGFAEGVAKTVEGR